MTQPPEPHRPPEDPPQTPATGPVVVGGATGVPAPRTGPLRGWTLRRKLVVSTVVLFVAVTLLTGLGTLFSMQRSLMSNLDQQVISQSSRVRPAIGDGDEGRSHGHPPPGLGGDFLLLQVTGGTAQQNLVFNREGTATRLSPQQMAALVVAGLTDRPHTVDLGDELGRYRLIGTTSGGRPPSPGCPRRAPTPP